MIRKSNILLATAIFGLVTGMIWLRRQVEVLTAENTLLRNEASQEAPAYRPDEQSRSDLSSEPPSLSRGTFGDEQLREVLRLRGDVGVLKRQLTQLTNESAEQRTQRQIDLGKFRFDTDKQVSEEQVLVNVARVALEELRADLSVPDSLTNLNDQQVWSTPGLRQYSPYFRFKARCDEMQKSVDSHQSGFQQSP
jgi:hypothetical protein